MNFLRKLLKPSAKLSILALVVIGIVIGAVGFFATQQTLHATSTNAFCMSCHSGHSLEQEVLESPHGNNNAGIVVQCQQCHLPPQPLQYLVKKVIVSKDIIGYLTIDGFETQDWLETNRKQQADLALKYLRSIDSSTCQSCHNSIYTNPPANMKKMAVRMHAMNFKKDADKRKTCVDCHKGVAHPYPKK